MPTIPVYGGPQLRDQALRGGFQRTPDVSSNTRALAAGFNAVAEVADKVVLRDEQTAAYETQAKITSEWLQWDAQARQQFRGQNVDGYAPAATEWWKKAADTYGKDLSPRAKEMASRGLMERQFKALDSVGLFTVAEKERHFDETAAANITTAIQFGVTNNDTAGAAQQVREAVAGIGARKGWTTEQVQAEQLKNLSMLHLAQVTKLAAQDPDKARAYYDTNKAEIAAANQQRVEEVLTAESDNQFARKFAAENATVPYAEQIKKAGAITDPQRREKVLLAVKQQQAEIKQAKAADEEDASDNAWQMFSKGQRIPETILARMDGRERAQLGEAQRARAERLAGGAGGKTVKTSPETLAKVYDMMRDDPEGFKKLRMASLVEYMSPSDIEQVSRIQRDMLKPEKETGAITAVQAIESYSEGLDKKDAVQFKRRAFDALDQFQIEKGRAPTTAERRGLLDELTREVVIERPFWFDSKTPAFKADKTPGKGVTGSWDAPAGAVRVRTIEEARALKPGTRFIDPQGIERTR